MSSPYGWGITPKQPSQAGESKPTPAQAQPSRAAGYSQKQEAQPSQAAGYSQSQHPQQTPTYGFNLPSQQESQSTPQYGFGTQQQEQRVQENQPAPQYGFGAQQQEQPAPQYGFGAQQQYQQSASQPAEPYGQASQQYAGAPAQQYQRGINAQQGYYPSMQELFDNNDKYNTKAILGFIFTFLFWPVGLVLSIMGRNEINKNGGKGKGLTTASFVLCGLSIVSTIVVTAMVLTGALNAGAGRASQLAGQQGGYQLLVLCLCNF